MRKQPRPQRQILRQRNIYLPDDLVINNILTRLPVKSVMRFMCVCKSWYSSIKTSDFIDTHLSNYKDSHDNGYVIHMPLVRDTFYSSSSSSNTSIPVCTVAFDRTFDKISDVRIPSDLNFNQIVGSCNGLLCVANSDNVIYLWNPIIGKFKRLPDTSLGRLVNDTLGFAYHPENNDYKVVRISSTPFEAPVSYHEIEVYTLSSDSWRHVEIPSTTNVILYGNNSPLPIPLPMVNGALHWMSCILEGEENCRSRTIMAFDVNSEKFRKLALPHGSIDGNTLQTFLASFKGKLAFITRERSEQPGTQYSIWVMKEYGVVESWNKLCVVPFKRVSHCSAFTENGSLLVFYITKKKPDYKFVLVDTETLHEKKDPDIQQLSHVAGFMESLVLLNGTNMVAS